MVGQDQRGTFRRSPAELANPYADQRAENAMIKMGNGPLQPQVECDADQLERQQHKREREEGEGDEDDTDHESASLSVECRRSRGAGITARRGYTQSNQ